MSRKTTPISLNNPADVRVIDNNFIIVENELDGLHDRKQNKLTAGTGINISDDVISATGGGGGGIVLKKNINIVPGATSGRIILLDDNAEETSIEYRLYEAIFCGKSGKLSIRIYGGTQYTSYTYAKNIDFTILPDDADFYQLPDWIIHFGSMGIFTSVSLEKSSNGTLSLNYVANNDTTDDWDIEVYLEA